MDGAARRPTAVVDLTEEVQLGDAELARHRNLRVGVHGEGDEAVDLGGTEAGVVARRVDGLHGELELAATGVLGEVSRADAGNRRLAPQERDLAHTVSTTVPVTWSPGR